EGKGRYINQEQVKIIHGENNEDKLLGE
ncbi:MAG: hypothetical protein UT63_C0018G0001, partial [Candidatus Gottesmanbacteria bacterium GW2011_GWC2_39_8]